MTILPASHTTSSGTIIYHEISKGVIIISDGAAIHLDNAAWRELIQYGVARDLLENQEVEE